MSSYFATVKDDKRIFDIISRLVGLIVLPIFLLCVYGCDNSGPPITDTELSRLRDKNEKLNRAFESKDWHLIYDLWQEQHREGISDSPIDSAYFFESVRNFELASIDTVRTVYCRWTSRSRAETASYIVTSLVIPGIIDTTAADTSFNRWRFVNKKWYLDYWDERVLKEPALPPEFEELQRELEKELSKSPLHLKIQRAIDSIHEARRKLGK